jgi:hypothetical protein
MRHWTKRTTLRWRWRPCSGPTTRDSLVPTFSTPPPDSHLHPLRKRSWRTRLRWDRRNKALRPRFPKQKDLQPAQDKGKGGVPPLPRRSHAVKGEGPQWQNHVMTLDLLDVTRLCKHMSHEIKTRCYQATWQALEGLLQKESLLQKPTPNGSTMLALPTSQRTDSQLQDGDPRWRPCEPPTLGEKELQERRRLADLRLLKSTPLTGTVAQWLAEL